MYDGERRRHRSQWYSKHVFMANRIVNEWFHNELLRNMISLKVPRTSSLSSARKDRITVISMALVSKS